MRGKTEKSADIYPVGAAVSDGVLKWTIEGEKEAAVTGRVLQWTTEGEKEAAVGGRVLQ